MYGEPPYQVQVETCEVGLLQELVQILVQYLEGDTGMASEIERILHPDQVAPQLRVMQQCCL